MFRSSKRVYMRSTNDESLQGHGVDMFITILTTGSKSKNAVLNGVMA